MERTRDHQLVRPLLAPAAGGDFPPLSQFLDQLAETRLINPQDLDQFLSQCEAYGEDEAALLAEELIQQGLLNRFQLKRILAGQTFGLVLGNYRVLDWIGSGGMGTVYKAEHVHMKRPVAIKVLITEDDDNAVFLQRFSSEMQALAVLRHPNIVLAFDAGEVQFPCSPSKRLRYLVMEYVPGKNLEQLVIDQGALPIPLACDLIRQAASGLRHAHEHGLVHRDIKPSNLLVTGLAGEGPHAPGEGQVKILDFGLARLCRRRCTAAHAMLGTVDYMAPEQARDARSVDIRADIYALGGTLYWLLTGHRPFPSDRPPVEELLARQHETPTAPRTHRADIPLELEAVVCQMMARDPNDRYPTPLAVITALNEFLEPPSFSSVSGLNGSAVDLDMPYGGRMAAVLRGRSENGDTLRGGTQTRQVLIASAAVECRLACQAILQAQGMICRDAASEDEVSQALADFPADAILVDGTSLPEEGMALCRRLRSEAPLPHLKLLLLVNHETSAPSEADVLCDEMLHADEVERLPARLRMVLRLKDAEERADRAGGMLLSTNSQLEQALAQHDHTLHQAQDVLIVAMAKMAELRGQESSAHLRRMQQYVRVLAEEAMRLPAFNPLIDDKFARMIERCVLLHDIGKVAIPDHILLKPGKLDAEERIIMESHTVLGANLLEAVARQHGACLAFLSMATDIVRGHHERYDGGGYPDGLMGDAIPLAARITAIADVYDAMRSTLVYKPGLSHAAVRRLMQASQGQFDPALMVAFGASEGSFKLIFDQTCG